MKVPIDYIEGNIIVTSKKEMWAAYEMVGFSYDNKSKSKQIADFRRITSFLSSLKNKVKIFILPRVYSFNDHFNQLKKNLSGPFAALAEVHANDTRDYLIDLLGKEGSEHSQYIFIKLGNKNDLLEATKDSVKKIKSLPQEIKEFFLDRKREIEEVAGFSGLEIYEHEMTKVQGNEREVFNQYKANTVNTGRSLRRLDEHEISWISQRPFWLGIGEPPTQSIFTKNQKKVVADRVVEDQLYFGSNKKKADISLTKKGKVIRPRKAEFIKLSNGLVEKQENRTLKLTQMVNGESISSYCSYLTVSDIPDGYWVPGHEWLYYVQDIEFPVSVAIEIDPIDNEKSKTKVNNKELEIEEQGKMTSEAGKDFKSGLQDAFEGVKELERSLSDYHFPLLDVSITFELHAESEEKLKNYRTWLKSIYDRLDFKLVCPAGEQLSLMQHFFPGSERKVPKDYTFLMTPPELAAGMLGAQKRLGDNQGFFIGFTGNRNKPVFMDPSLAPQLDKSASGSFTGTLGGGKSYLANLIGGYLTPLYGGKSLIIDPKGDRTKWKKYFKEFEGQLEYVTLEDREEDYGKLDPFGFLPVEKAVEVAQNIVTYLASVRVEDDEYTALVEATEQMKHLENPSMYKLIEVLESTDDDDLKDLSKKLAKRCRAFAKAPYGKLLFYDGPLSTIKLEKQITILQVNNLKLPEQGKMRTDFDIKETLSVALMYPITAFAIAFSESEEFTVTILDEAWAFMTTQAGAELVTRLIRTGRSMFAAVYVISQNVKDLMAAKQNLGVKFIFRSNDIEEIHDILAFLDLEKTEENIEMIKNIETGAPLMQDMEGNIGIVKVDAVFEHVHQALMTTPTKKKDGDAA
ncbi:hypothetical protein NRS6110_04231 [Bacillus subtilis]|uniref:ATP-binding protein n=1 Tax=Bacillus subtilis group TaxID=653685 RepID=UPI0011A4EF99|nr:MULTISPECIES: ATP-binding protein [Bacillus subtilis group]MEC2400519.1 ATP-binding protein [Bacillus subtilis]MED4660879.1 ATP-binding protein [Bacillus subtilis]MED4667697.1 ATP-binding protein [Bacillus subtilis]CAF1782893.1 hypothetical protein NRS6116_03918 [Bacillus subtilis]CAF1786344.1 hypothetical protein NRS6110_04231 [Bacillus subtilis]